MDPEPTSTETETKITNDDLDKSLDELSLTPEVVVVVEVEPTSTETQTKITNDDLDKGLKGLSVTPEVVVEEESNVIRQSQLPLNPNFKSKQRQNTAAAAASTAADDGNWRRRSPPQKAEEQKAPPQKAEEQKAPPQKAPQQKDDGQEADSEMFKHYRNRNGGGTGETLGFKDQKDIGHFMTGEGTPSKELMAMTVDEIKPSALLPRKEIMAFKGTYLGVNYEESKKIVDYEAFHLLKQMYFCRWLTDSRYFQNIGTDQKWKKPDFISNEGRIVDILLTPMKKPYGWQFYAIKYQDIIFLSSMSFKNQQASTLESHCGYVYREMVTAGNPKTEIINEFEKLLSATEVTFGNHQLLVVSETDALDDVGNCVKVRAYKPLYGNAPSYARKAEQGKFMKFWAVSTIPGVKSLVLGHRDKQHVLQDTSIILTEELWDRANFNEGGKQKCYTFANRMLDFIKSEFHESDRFVVKLFKWEGISRNRNRSAKSTNANGDGNTNNSEEKQEKKEGPPDETEKQDKKEGPSDETDNADGDNKKKEPFRKAWPSRPQHDLEGDSVICTTIVDTDEIMKVSGFVLPDWFVDVAFNEHQNED